MLKKTLTAATLTGALLLGSAGAASAHECFVVNRSAKGAAGASHSDNWVQIPLAELFTNAHEFLGGQALTPDQVTEAVAMAVEAGLPADLALFTKNTIPQGMPEGKESDLKGIDHLDSHIGMLVGIYWSFFPEV